MAGNPTVVKDLRGIAKLAHEMGLVVGETPGWEGRGRPGPFSPRYLVNHHTATSVDVTKVLMDGRPDLTGPLCHMELQKSGRLLLIASGRANHCGVATITNEEAYGLEVTGPIPLNKFGPDAFPQYASYICINAAVRIYHGWDRSRTFGHKEIARPIGRKVDPAFDIPQFENAVDKFIATYKRGDAMLDANDKKYLEGLFNALDDKVEGMYRLGARGGIVGKDGKETRSDEHFKDSNRHIVELLSQQSLNLSKEQIDQLSKSLNEQIAFTVAETTAKLFAARLTGGS